MSAEVIAGELGLDLYTVDLATVVDKYVGETEKNLERIFTEAAGVNGVLLFDEADAMFGKRSEVRDAHDRYANIESAYLLQRMETFDGLAILVDQPARQHRRGVHPPARLRSSTSRRRPRSCGCSCGTHCLAPPLPLGDDLDLAFCASRVRAHRRQHPLRRDHRRLPRRGGGPPGRDGGADHGRRAGVPQARPAGAGREFGRYLALLR